jgi:putative FmdB family regulatory protein
VFEKIQKFSDAPLTEHEECGGAVERLISAPAFHLKGTGWYVTDYAKGSGGAKGEIKHGKSGDGESSGKSEGGESKSGEKPESKSEAKTESKSDSKTESKPAAASTKSE